MRSSDPDLDARAFRTGRVALPDTAVAGHGGKEGGAPAFAPSRSGGVYAEKVHESQVFSAEIGLFETRSYGWWRAWLQSLARRMMRRATLDSRLRGNDEGWCGTE